LTPPPRRAKLAPGRACADRRSRRPAPTNDSGDYEQPTYENTAGGTRTSGTVTAFRNRAGESIALTVDALGRVTAKNLPGSDRT
jgi:YD repeat-containing protein